MNSRLISRREILVLISMALPTWSAAQSINPKSFEVQIKNGVQLVNNFKYLKQDSDGLWQKRWLLVDDVKYDVVKSESALRPLIGTLQVSIVSMFGVKKPTRADAEAGYDIEEAPSVLGGKNISTFEYDLKFEPNDTGWAFLEGKARRMPISHLSFDWFNLSDANIRASHEDILRAFETPVTLKKPPKPQVRVTPRRET